MLICVTGVSGTGKTTILKILESRGYAVVILDEKVHECYQFNHEGYRLIKKHYGLAYVDAAGVNRKKLGQLVFNNSTELNKLNHLLEPLIRKMILSIKRKYAGKICLVEAAALLTTSEMYAAYFDDLILIEAPISLINENTKVKFSYLNNSVHNPVVNQNNLQFNLVINNNSTPMMAANTLESYLFGLIGNFPKFS